MQRNNKNIDFLFVSQVYKYKYKHVTRILSGLLKPEKISSDAVQCNSQDTTCKYMIQVVSENLWLLIIKSL